MSWLFLFSTPVGATQALEIETIPVSPVFNQQFECVITLDTDDSNIACDLLFLNAPDTQKPWDICPKVGELGHRYTEGNKRHYNCLAGQETGVAAPGKYKIVAWKFSDDGARGNVIYSREITIFDKPLPTLTLIPSETQTPLPSVTRAANVIGEPSFGQPTRTLFTPPTGGARRLPAPNLPNPNFISLDLPWGKIWNGLVSLTGKVVTTLEKITVQSQSLAGNIFTNFIKETAF